MKAYYYGTSLRDKGHYHHNLYKDSISSNYSIRDSDLPFYCERFPVVRKEEYCPNGTVEFYNIGHWSICAIQGSCSDTRPGSKSIFYFDEPLSAAQMDSLLRSLPIFNQIIEQMPFRVQIFKP